MDGAFKISSELFDENTVETGRKAKKTQIDTRKWLRLLEIWAIQKVLIKYDVNQWVRLTTRVNLHLTQVIFRNGRLLRW